jgi:hypothetical protein
MNGGICSSTSCLFHIKMQNQVSTRIAFSVTTHH